MDKLQFINEQMDILAVPYEFGEWTSGVQYPYCVGEITEEPTTTEDGFEQSTLLIKRSKEGLPQLQPRYIITFSYFLE